MLRNSIFAKSSRDLRPSLDALLQRTSVMVSALVVHTLAVGSLWMVLAFEMAKDPPSTPPLSALSDKR